MPLPLRAAPLAIAVVLAVGCNGGSGADDPTRTVEILSEGTGPTPDAPLFPTGYGTVTLGQIGPRFDVGGRILRRIRVFGADVAESESWIQETELGVFLAGTGDGFIEQPLFMVPAEPRHGFAWEQRVTDTLTWVGEVAYDADRDQWSIQRGFVGQEPETVVFTPGAGRASFAWFSAPDLVDPEPAILPEPSIEGRGELQAPFVLSMELREEVGEVGFGVASLTRAERGNAGITIFRQFAEPYQFRPGAVPNPGGPGLPDPGSERVQRVPPLYGFFEWRDGAWRVAPAPLSSFVSTTTTDGARRSIEAFGTGAIEALEGGRRTHLGRVQLADGEVLTSAWFRADGTVQGVVSEALATVSAPDGSNRWVELAVPDTGIEVPEPPTMVAARQAADIEVCWTGEPSRAHEGWRIAGVQVVDTVPTRPGCVLLLYPWPDTLTDEVAEFSKSAQPVTGWVEGFGDVTLGVRDGIDDGYPLDFAFEHTPGHVVSALVHFNTRLCVPDEIDRSVCYRMVGDAVEARTDAGDVVLGPAYWDTDLVAVPDGGVVVRRAYGTAERVWYRLDAEAFSFTPATSFWRDSLSPTHYCDHAYRAGTLECFTVPDGTSTGVVEATAVPVHLEGTTWLLADSGVEARAVDIATMQVSPLGFQPPSTPSLATLSDGAAWGLTDTGLMRIDREGYTVYDVPRRAPAVYSPEATRRLVVDRYGVYDVWSNWTFRYGWNGLDVIESGG